MSMRSPTTLLLRLQNVLEAREGGKATLLAIYEVNFLYSMEGGGKATLLTFYEEIFLYSIEGGVKVTLLTI